MSAYQVAAFAVVASVLAAMLKREKAELALIIQAASAVTILLSVVSTVAAIFQTLENFASAGGLDTDFVRLLVRTLCMSVAGEWAVAFCKDAGLTALALVVELACGALLISVCLPLLQTILQFTEGLFV